MNRDQRLNGFQFNNNLILNQNIHAKSGIKNKVLVFNRHRNLLFNFQAYFFQFMVKAYFINIFQ